MTKYSHYYTLRFIGGHLVSHMQVRIMQTMHPVSYSSSLLTSLTHRMWK